MDEDKACAEGPGPMRHEKMDCEGPPRNRSMECLDHHIKMLEEKLKGFKALRNLMESTPEKTPLGGMIAELIRHRF